MQTVFDILEWPKILEHLESCCQTGYGRLLVDAPQFLKPTLTEAQQEIEAVSETKTLIQRYGDITLTEPPDMLPLIKRLQKSGIAHSPQELGELLTTLKTMRQMARFFIQHRSREETPTLLPFIESITLPNATIETLETVVSEKGEIQEGVTPEYGALKAKIQETQSHIHNTLQHMIHRPQTARYLQEPLITQREGRSVLPVKSEHKVDVPGIVHDVSATGVTLYIEPKGVIESNNKLVALKSQLAQEIQRILKQVSESLHPDAEHLEHFIHQSAQLDLWMAKARQSLRLKANPVQLLEQPGIFRLKQTKHPLLLFNLPQVVANDVILEPPHQTMLITGPNTGGKTVLLKLLGLCALMSRAGLHLPVSEGSSLSFFRIVLADIGDPQSITQNLSTFSGHIDRLKQFLEEPQLSDALILIDEICAGTDPQEGSALAEALLEAFYQRGATTIVTSHIGELKVAAHRHPGYLNACVEFNAETLQPTYRLILGVPGTSNALNIAAQLGIPPKIIEVAREKITQPVSESATLIESLETKNRQLTEDLEEISRLKAEIEWEEKQLRDQLNRLEGEKKKTLQMFREGLQHKLRRIEQEVDDLKKSVRQPKKHNQESVQKLAGRFKKVHAQTGEMFSEETQKLYRGPSLDWDSLHIGDEVESRSLSMTATIVDKLESRQELTLQAGILKTTVPLSDIIRKAPSQQGPTGKKSKSTSKSKGSSGSVYTEKPKTWSVDCDVRGMTSEDAIGLVEKFLDDAMLSGAHSVHVIHGLGTGTLKKAIRSYLKELPYIKSFGQPLQMKAEMAKPSFSCSFLNRCERQLKR